MDAPRFNRYHCYLEEWTQSKPLSRLFLGFLLFKELLELECAKTKTN